MGDFLPTGSHLRESKERFLLIVRYSYQNISVLPLCPPPFFAILRYSVSVSMLNELSNFGVRGLLETVTISKDMPTTHKMNNYRVE